MIRGVYGNGNERRAALGGAYDKVMAIVNQRLGGSGGASTAANCGSVCVTVRSGDTLSSIAARNGGLWNQYTGYRSGNPNVIYAGETVCRRTGTGTVATGGRYVVRSGDTVSAIAERTGLKPASAWRVPSGNINRIYVGQTITYYGSVSATAAPSTTYYGSTHVVSAGESLWKIYGSGWYAAAQRNGLRPPYTIYPGQRLR